MFTTCLSIPTSVDFPGALPMPQHLYQPIQDGKGHTKQDTLGELESHFVQPKAQDFFDVAKGCT